MSSLYLDQDQLEALTKYKYSGVDLSLTSKYILNPFWNWLVLQFPETMAPNLITLTGLLFMISATGLVLDANEPSSVLLFFYISFCISTYLNMDAIDGKQARRTGTSSPLGELFDHGCDAINMMLMAVLIPFIFGLTNVWLCVGMTLSGYAAFYAATWEEYQTGTLFLDFISGPVEGAWGLVCCSFLSAVLGVTFWDNEIGGVAIKNLVPPIYMLGSLFSLKTSFQHALEAKKSSAIQLLRQLVPVSLYHASCLALFYFNSERIKLHWFIFFTGLPACFRISSTIVAHITKQGKLQQFFYPLELFPLAALILGFSTADKDALTSFMVFGTLISFVVYMASMLAIISDICTFLDINCLTIKEKKEIKE